MRERPILFNGAMVRAILAGQKTQTRRVVKGHALDWLGKAQFTPEYVANPGNDLCPFGQPGDRLWVRETTVNVEKHGYLGPVYLESEEGRDCLNFGLAPAPDDMTEVEPHEVTLRPSIHMPRSMCRLVLEITAVRVERLHEISESDAIAEGADENVLANIRLPRTHARAGLPMVYADCREVFADLWDTTGGDWDSNPWVWVIEFNKINEVSNG